MKSGGRLGHLDPGTSPVAGEPFEAEDSPLTVVESELAVPIEAKTGLGTIQGFHVVPKSAAGASTQTSICTGPPRSMTTVRPSGSRRAPPQI